VTGADCTAFLQWALPRAGLRWAGFRKVRGQVCKRLKRRMADLGLADVAAYRAVLEADPAEWRAFDDCCRVTISRFFRDRAVFERLRQEVLPAIATRAAREQRPARIWSAGCASGEEPYTLRILWDLDVAPACEGAALAIVATDSDPAMLARAAGGCFAATSLRELPPHLLQQAFEARGTLSCVKARHRHGIAFLCQDLRTDLPDGSFDLILCRNMAFTYFAPAVQQQVMARLPGRLVRGGHLVIGRHEQLPQNATGFRALPGAPQIFRHDAALS
jgi:chemotaxis protein methyltransferase CheR